MDITKFLRVSKNRDLSDQSYSGGQQKKVREASLEELKISESKNSVDSPECLQILFNCLRNAEWNVTQSSQIKDELQLNGLTETVEFITKKFDQYEIERKEKEKIINDL